MQPTMRHGQKLPGLHWGALKPEIYVHACIRAGLPVGPVCLHHHPSLPCCPLQLSRPAVSGIACWAVVVPAALATAPVSFICTADNIHEMLKIHTDVYALNGTIFHTHLQSDLCGLLCFCFLWGQHINCCARNFNRASANENIYQLI